MIRENDPRRVYPTVITEMGTRNFADLDPLQGFDVKLAGLSVPAYAFCFNPVKKTFAFKTGVTPYLVETGLKVEGTNLNVIDARDPDNERVFIEIELESDPEVIGMGVEAGRSVFTVEYAAPVKYYRIWALG